MFFFSFSANYRQLFQKTRFSLLQIAALCLYNIQSENPVKKKDMLAPVS